MKSVKIASLLLFALILLSATYARPAADDLCLAGETQRLGTLAYTQVMYQSWSGRWGQLALQSALSPLEPTLSAIVPIVLLLGLWAAWTWATGNGWMVLLGIILWATIAPKLDETLFWASASITYAVPLLLAGVWVGMAKRGYGWASLALVAFIAGGFSEMLNLQLGYALLLVTLLVPSWRKVGITSGIALALSFAIVALASGNEIRSSHFPNARQFIPALGIAWNALQDYALALLPYAPLLLVALWAGTKLAPKEPMQHRALWAIGVFFALFGWLYIGVFSSAYAQGAGIVARQFLPLHFGVIVACFGWGMLLGRMPQWWAAIAWVVLLYLMPYWGNVAQDFRSHAALWDDRHAQLSAGQTEVMLIGGFGDITTDSRHWVNQCAARWYQVEAIHGIIR